MKQTLLRDYTLIALLTGIVVLPAPTAAGPSPKLPRKSAILQTMTLANDYFMRSWPDPGKVIVTNKTRPSNIWRGPCITKA